MEGALGDIFWNPTTAVITFNGTTDAFVQTTTNNRQWVSGANGQFALGTANRTFTLYNSTGNLALYFQGNRLTGSGTLTLQNAHSTDSAGRAVFGSDTTLSSFTGNIVLNDRVLVGAGAASAGMFPNSNMTVSGEDCWLIPFDVSNNILGSSARQLTINSSNVFLGFAGRTWSIAYVVTLGSTPRTLTMRGVTTVTGSVTSSAGITLAGDTHYRNLSLPSGLLTGLSGAATLTGGGLDVPSGSWTPTAISVGSNSRFRFTSGTSDYSFPRTPTGAGIVSIGGNFASNGVTFPASPTEGNIGSFTGSVEAVSANGGNSKVRISELPGGLRLIGYANVASNPQATITYLGSGHSGATTLVIDSEDNTQTANLTAGTYSLLSSGAGPIVLSGIVQRTNSNAGVTPLPASARMNLTLGGSNTGDNTLSGDISEASATATLGITKADAGRWVLSGANSSHTGIHTISGGTLSAQSEKALGSATSTGGVFISGSGALELAGSITLDKSVTDFTVSNATNPIQSVGTNQLLTKQLTLSTTPTLTITSGNKLTLSPQGSGVIAGANGITKAGDGELELTAKANTYNGTVTVSAGTLTVGSVANSGSPGAWGQGSSAVEVTGTLRYNGSGGSTTRSVRMNGTGTPTIDASGTSALFLSSVTQDTNAKTMVLRGTNTDANTVSSNIADNIGAVSLEKLDGGKWALAGGTLSYTGTTTVSGGTLRVETANSNTTSGAVTIGASGTVELITDTLASSGATAGEVLGTGNVTVNGGTIKTRGGTTQKGQVRYGGNLTFGAGSSLYIGAAA
jgi:autotransporter-associated beta strand protein